MNLLVDLSIFGPRRAGVALYAIEMAHYLENRFAATTVVPVHMGGIFRNQQICPSPIGIRGSILCRHPLSNKALGRPQSLLYCPHDRIAVGAHQQVITLHDTIPYSYPTRNPVEWIYYRHLLPSRINRLAAVFTVSESSKRDIVGRFGLNPERVHVIPNGIDLSIWPPGHKADAENPYLLTVSANRPYKNTVEIIQHHSLWAHKYRLKIVSSNARYGTAIRSAVKSHGLDCRVDFIDDISQAELVALYRGATAMIYPSLMEGFGRPPLEAMAVGCPAILTDIPAHIEFFKSAGIFIKSGDASSWNAAFLMLNDKAMLTAKRRAGFELSEKLSLGTSHARLLSSLLAVFPPLADIAGAADNDAGSNN